MNMKHTENTSKTKSLFIGVYRFIKTANLFLVPQLIISGLMILFVYTLYTEPDWNTVYTYSVYGIGALTALMFKLVDLLQGS